MFSENQVTPLSNEGLNRFPPVVFFSLDAFPEALDHNSEYEVISVHEASAAAQRVSDGSAAAIIVDLETAADIGTFLKIATEAESPVPVIVLGRSLDTEAVVSLLSSGAFDCLDKPVDSRLLHLAIKRSIEHFNLNRLRLNYQRLVRETVDAKTKEITRGRDFLKGMLNSSTLVSVILTDLDQNIRFWNKGAENIFGYSAEEMLGAKITRIYPKDKGTIETVRDLQDEVKGLLRTVHGKMRQIAKDGRELTILLAISPMVGTDGQVQGILGIGQDVTEETRLHDELIKSMEMLKKTQDVSIFTLAQLAESRDEETGSHLRRIQSYCRIICRRLAAGDKYADLMTEQFTEDLVRSSLLHDVGKVAMPDSVLLSHSVFTDEEYAIMKMHPVYGGKALQEAVEKLGEESFLSLGRDVAYYHHERWDGAGYPMGLKGEAIPLAARIVALADVYDALTTARRYKPAFSHEKAFEMIVREEGKQFDPDLVDAFLAEEAEFKRVRSELQGGELNGRSG
jgi:PAS domain S-box-containing protein